MKTEQEITARLEFLHGPQDEWPTATELLEWVLAPSPVVHEAVGKHRCEHLHDGWTNREKIFADKWKQENDPPPFLNSGIGILTHLLCSRPAKFPSIPGGHEIYCHLTQEEATAAASAIQWLGSNCGWCWLEDCIRACGFDVVMRRNK